MHLERIDIAFPATAHALVVDELVLMESGGTACGNNSGNGAYRARGRRALCRIGVRVIEDVRAEERRACAHGRLAGRHRHAHGSGLLFLWHRDVRQRSTRPCRCEKRDVSANAGAIRRRRGALLGLLLRHTTRVHFSCAMALMDLGVYTRCAMPWTSTRDFMVISSPWMLIR